MQTQETAQAPLVKPALEVKAEPAIVESAPAATAADANKDRQNVSSLAASAASAADLFR
ncbi:hypothetical protein D3C87_2077140 [compost metagenome]